MRKAYLLIISSIILYSNVTSQFHIDFEDSVLSGWIQYPSGHWNTYNDSYNNHWLWHSYDNSEQGTAVISLKTDLSITDSETNWQFQIRHGYNPSSSNHWAVVFLSDAVCNNIIPGNLANGYAVGVNINDNNDLLSFYRIDHGNYITLSASMNWQEKIGTDKAAGISINRNETGDWIINVDCNGGFDSLITVTEITDNTYQSGSFFGIYYNYTSSQDMKLWFDDFSISGRFVDDIIAPRVTFVKAFNDSVLEVNFSEPVQYQIDVILNNIKVNNLSYPDSIFQVSSQCFYLFFQEKFKTENTIEIRGISDFSQNIISDTIITFFWYVAEIYDIIISEIMSSPTPSLGLPGKEYLELFNRSSFPVTATDWKICVNNKCRDINFSMDNNTYLILCDIEDTSAFNSYGNICGVESLYSLTNDGAVLELKNNLQQTIHYVQYNSGWYNSVYKQEGGWSLEMIDTDYPCVEKENWSSSINIDGGTPGMENSIIDDNPDFTNPSLLRSSIVSDNAIKLFFSENMDNSFLLNPDSYVVDEIISPVKAEQVWPGYSSVTLTFDETFEYVNIYTIQTDENLQDCAGNRINDYSTSFALPAYPDSNDLIINEILFEADDLGTEFIEIYNRSQNTINLDNIRIAIRENYTGDLKNITSIDEEGYLIFPEDYFAITNNLTNLLMKYNVIHTSKVYENKLPALPDDEASIVICDKNLNIIDLVYYSHEWQYSLLSSSKGVSLERINPEISSMLQTNWHSASSTSGYATPGYENSQYLNETNDEDIVTIEPEVFSPDNDGYNDLLQIQINPGKEGYTCHIKIFDSKGRLSRYLSNNILLGTNNLLTWDGTNDNGKIEAIGIYIIFIRLFNPEGDIMEFKRSCVLGRKIN